jgi:hypothetical protein
MKMKEATIIIVVSFIILNCPLLKSRAKLLLPTPENNCENLELKL